MDEKYFKLIRPFGAFVLSSFGAYCHYKGITFDTALHALFDGCFPGWMYSRHIAVKSVGRSLT